MVRPATIALMLILGGCVSTQMKPFIGKPVQELQIAYGPPVQIIEMPEGRRAYQFHQGGGDFMVPGSSTTTITPAGRGLIAQTTSHPGGIVSTPGCFPTFIAVERSGNWIVESIRVPKGLVC